MKTQTTRRGLLVSGAAGMAVAMGAAAHGRVIGQASSGRRFKFAHIDVFTDQPLLGNPLDVFLDAHGLSDAEMLAITRETFLSETTFVFPRAAAVEAERGVRVRIFTPDGEVPFAGHPTLGTAMTLRNLRLAAKPSANLSEIALDLNVGKIPVHFLTDGSGHIFGEMQQVPPVFSTVHDKDTVARLHNLSADDIEDFGPIQTVSTGLPFAIVPLKRLSTLQALRFDVDKLNAYTATQPPNFGFYYVTRDTGDANVSFRARCVWPGGEDAATGSAAGCAISWLVRCGAAKADQPQKIRQGVEMKRTSDILVRASKDGDRIFNVRVGGYAIQTMQGELAI
jgi:trans-2,3-dihydro-3-hydroxyanthranilate isomerase